MVMLPFERDTVQYATISSQEVVERGYRLDAKFYGIEGRRARQIVNEGKYPTLPLCGDGGLAGAYYIPRFKRIYVDKSDYPIYYPAQVNELYPKPVKYLSARTPADIGSLAVKKGQILMTRSGSIGNCTYVGDTINGFLFSDDLIRIEAKKYAGYIYAYLKSKIGYAIINTSNYGAVISHIEPEHLERVALPNPPDNLKKEIHLLVMESFQRRDKSNKLMDEAQSLLEDAFKFPDMEKMQKQAAQFDKNAEVLNFTVSSNELNYRFDASYHIPIVKVLEKHLKKHAKGITTVGDRCVSRGVILPGRFKRIYVEEGQGVKFFGGKQIFELYPGGTKYLSRVFHRERIKEELAVSANTTLITVSGTNGKVTIVPEHWKNCLPNQHIARVVPANQSIAGYLYAWLASDYAVPLILRHTYGAVVDEINGEQISEIIVPFCRDASVQARINQKVLDANKERTAAYALEQKALAVLDEKIIYATG